MKNILKKLLEQLLVTEDEARRYTNGVVGNTSLGQQQNKTWGPENTRIWNFQITKTNEPHFDRNKGQEVSNYSYSPHLIKQLGWNDSQTLIDLQSNPDKSKRIPYTPNVYIRSEGSGYITGFVVAADEQSAKKMLDAKIREYRLGKAAHSE